MKSVEFLIDSRLGAKKLVIFCKKGGQCGPISSLVKKFSFQTTYHLKVEEIFFPKIYIAAWLRQRVIL